MSFVNLKYFPHLLIGFLIFSMISIYINRKYFKWIKEYWFFERTWRSRVASVLYLLSFFLILISLLDLRGPEEKILSNLPDQRTIIVLDSSASMLAEDVRPSRFIKAIQMARHFVKSAAGHQVSIVLFSDTQKRLIPFTDDLDLIDSRLAALEKINSVGGGSNITQAVAETIGYLSTSEDGKPSSGNILVFTDAEESEGEFDLDLGDNINLAIVGIGTSKGGNIPLRWEDGSFRGYKNQKGEPVTTKLDENYIKKIGKSVKNYKYWIANSYSLPTEEVLSFFRTMYKKSQNKGDQRIRPVLSHLILIPAILVYCVSVLFGRMRTFKQAALVLITMCQLFNPSWTVQATETEEEKIKPIPQEIQKDLQRMKNGKSSREEILKVGEKFLKNEDIERAVPLFEEYAKSDDSVEIQFNHATALLQSGQFDKALPIIKNVLNSKASDDIKNKMRNNVINSMNMQNSQKQKSDKNKKDQNKNESDSKDDKKSDDSQSGKSESKDKSDNGKGNSKENSKDKQKNEQDKKQQDGKSGSSSKDNKSDSGDSKEEKNKNEKDGESKKEEPKELKAPPREQKPTSVEAKEKMIEQQRKMKKTPAMIKQIMSDDRELQKRMMDTSTRERGNQKQKRDW
jgi:Ca-activated chloride channel family protein